MSDEQKNKIEQLKASLSGIGSVSLHNSEEDVAKNHLSFPLASTGMFFSLPSDSTPKQQLEMRDLILYLLEGSERFEELSRKYRLLKRDFQSIAESSGQKDFEKLLCANLMHFLGEIQQYGVLSDDSVVISENLSQYTIQIAKLKLISSDEYSVKVSTGELFVCQYRGYTVIVEREIPFTSTEKKHIKLTLRYISLLSMQNSMNRAMQLLTENSDPDLALTQGTEYLQACINNLVKEANIDPLTLAYNRRFVTRHVQELYAHNIPFSIVLVDIDFFKKVNDSYGHDAGDNILKELVALFQKNCRDSDVIARWGGEEFLIVLKGMNLETSVKKAGLLREQIASTDFIAGMDLTASFGVCSSAAQPLEDLTMLVRLADKALYRAKDLGRNRVEFHSE